MKGSPAKQSVRRKPIVGLVFCEDQNDAESLGSLALSIRSDFPKLHYCRKPLILLRDKEAAERRKRNAAGVFAVVRAKQALFNVQVIVAHQDCDALEPAHETLSVRIESELTNIGISNVVPATPAWEIEAWWYLWPKAVATVNSKWKRLVRSGNHGKIKNVKEQLCRDLRVKGVRDYEESDSRKIAAKVRQLGLVDERHGTSASFNDFCVRVRALRFETAP